MRETRDATIAPAKHGCVDTIEPRERSAEGLARGARRRGKRHTCVDHWALAAEWHPRRDDKSGAEYLCDQSSPGENVHVTPVEEGLQTRQAGTLGVGLPDREAEGQEHQESPEADEHQARKHYVVRHRSIDAGVDKILLACPEHALDGIDAQSVQYGHRHDHQDRNARQRHSDDCERGTTQVRAYERGECCASKEKKKKSAGAHLSQ